MTKTPRAAEVNIVWHEDMTRGIAMDIRFNARTGVYFKLLIGLAFLGSLFQKFT